MKDLNKEKCYSLDGITQKQSQELADYLNKVDANVWDSKDFSYYNYLYYRGDVWDASVSLTPLTRTTPIQSLFEKTIEELEKQRDELNKQIAELKKPKIDYDRLKTGSIVMIEYTGNHCCGIESIDASKPVTILLYKTKGYLYKGGFHQNKREYITFIQDDKVCHFTADDVDYITKVISY